MQESSSPTTNTDDRDIELKANDFVSRALAWTQDERLQSGGRRARSKAVASWERIYVYINSTKWGRKTTDFLVVEPREAPKRLGIFLASAIFILFGLMYMFSLVPRISHASRITLAGNARHSIKPQDVEIYGIVFYGRRATVEILDCYLQQNLARNGGWLEEVHFIVNTEDEEDLAWIEKTVKKVPGYKSIAMKEGTDPRDFESVWRTAVQSGRVYVKFDDDLVWLSDTIVEETVSTLLAHPEAFLVLANLINSAALGWLHHHYGAIHSYLPELSPPPETFSPAYGPKAWHASALPTYQPLDPSIEITAFPDTEKEYPGAIAEIGDVGGPPFANHRWLPLRDEGTLLPLTPIWRSEYLPNSADWRGWQLGAQQHYSLLQNLENDTLSLYHFGDNKDGIWNMRYMHANINCMAVWADDILDNLPFDVEEDDEAHFSIHLPRKSKRQTLVQTRAMASHFSFGTQRELYQTDLLERYRAYANEKVCGKRNQIPVREPGEGRRKTD